VRAAIAERHALHSHGEVGPILVMGVPHLARPTCHQRDSIEAHLTIVFAALTVSRWIEHRTGWSIRKLVKTARRYRTIQIQADGHVITAAAPCPTTSTKPSTASTAVQMRT
jgi:hypothetical protein